uniref:MICOS complex subunit MIC25 n=1 Tax=Leptobrachium leishanense TaxID=445787 RepID=A0A8C5PSJ6_9ANUR
MGGSASSKEGRRRVSFWVDEEDRVRVVRGIRLSDSVLSRVQHPSTDQNSSPSSGSERSSGTPSSRSSPEPQPKTEGIHTPPAGGDRHKLSDTDDDLYRRYEAEQAIIQEELARLAKRERETVHQRLSPSILQEKRYGRQESRRAEEFPADLDEWAKELERKDAELKRLDQFYKEQLTSIEKKNQEIFRMTAEQFHTAATNAEYRVRQRSYEPVCLDIQTSILTCYREQRQELLNCSNLAKQYRSCVREAQKEGSAPALSRKNSGSWKTNNKREASLSADLKIDVAGQIKSTS